MESGSGLLGDLLPDPLMDDSLVRSSGHDSPGLSMQRQVTSGSMDATPRPTHAMASDSYYAGVRSGREDSSASTGRTW
eukprot:5082072-Alexandrium_andersonii.AAC.1